MAVAAAAALLDELMGRSRNDGGAMKKKKIKWEDPEVKCSLQLFLSRFSVNEFNTIVHLYRFNIPNCRFGILQYCKYYMVKFCPHDLFVNTKADLGPCSKLHCEEAKSQFSDAEDTFMKLQYEEDFVRFAQGMLNEVERKIVKGEQRLALMGKSEPVSFPINFANIFPQIFIEF